MKKLITNYFSNHLNQKDNAVKACYAYHDDIAKLNGHTFQSAERDSQCTVCHRSREDVRWDEKQPQCIHTSHTGPHRFGGSAPWIKCIFCDNTREELQDSIQDIPGGYGFKNCTKYREIDIAAVLETEETKFQHTQDKAQKIVPTYIEAHGLSGSSLAILHHTHGVVPELASIILDEEFDEQLIHDYETEMLVEKNRSRADTTAKRKVVTISNPIKPE